VKEIGSIDTGGKFRAIDVPNYDPVNHPYLLNIDAPKLGNLHIFKPKDYQDKIAVYAGIDIRQYKKEFDALNDDFKENLLLDISQGLTMMNLIVHFHPHHMNLERILFQDMIYYDGLTKDRIMNSLTNTLNAYGFIITVLQKHKIIGRRFDPSEYI
jgi:hypothetical protein